MSKIARAAKSTRPCQTHYPTVSPASARLRRIAEGIRAASEGALSNEEAMDHAFRENPELYDRYAAAIRRRVAR